MNCILSRILTSRIATPTTPQILFRPFSSSSPKAVGAIICLKQQRQQHQLQQQQPYGNIRHVFATPFSNVLVRFSSSSSSSSPSNSNKAPPSSSSSPPTDNNKENNTFIDLDKTSFNLNKDGSKIVSHDHDTNKNLSAAEKVKHLWKAYGIIGIGTYFGLYFSTLGIMYGIVSTGVDTSGLLHLLQNSFLSEIVHIPEVVHGAVGDFMVAWIITKFTEPLRLAIAIAITPSVAKWIRRHK